VFVSGTDGGDHLRRNSHLLTAFCPTTFASNGIWAECGRIQGSLQLRRLRSLWPHSSGTRVLQYRGKRIYLLYLRTRTEFTGVVRPTAGRGPERSAPEFWFRFTKQPTPQLGGNPAIGELTRAVGGFPQYSGYKSEKEDDDDY
jgi:hypothetical protein